MDKAVSVEQLLDGASSIRNLHKGYLSNFLFDFTTHALWVSKGNCQTSRIGNTFFILNDNAECRNVFFCTTDAESLMADLAQLESETPGTTLVIRTVDKTGNPDNLGAAFERHGYRNIRSLALMSRRKTQERRDGSGCSEVAYATADMAPRISDLLNECGDRESGDIPSEEEILEFIGHENVLVHEAGGKIAGLAIFGKGKTADCLKYLIVSPEYRNGKTAGLLLDRLLHERNDSKRQVLWADKADEEKTSLYRHHGFKEEGSTARIFVKGHLKPHAVPGSGLMAQGKLRIVFFGEDAFSCVVLNSLLDAGHEVPLVVTPLYDNLIYKRLESICARNGISFIREKNINSERVCKATKDAKPDLGVISHFEKLIKQELIEIPEFGFINLHPSLLPDYRGMAPQHWPIINGDEEAGMTVHYVDETADTGDIIAQRRFALPKDCYVSDLQKIWLTHYRTFMLEAVSNVMHGRKTVGQKNIRRPYYGKLKVEQCRIPKEASVREAYNLVRGVSLPYHGAYWDNTIIYRAHISEENTPHADDEIGIVCDSEAGAALRLKDGTLAIDKFVEQ